MNFLLFASALCERESGLLCHVYKVLWSQKSIFTFSSAWSIHQIFFLFGVCIYITHNLLWWYYRIDL